MNPFYRLANWALDHSKAAVPCDWVSTSISYAKLGPHCYQLESTVWCNTGMAGCAARLLVGGGVVAELTQGGLLILHPGFVWDGPSGPTVDTLDSMIGAALHDALYRMHRQHKIPGSWRDEADDLAYRVWLQCGMYRPRARLWYRGLRVGARYAWTGEPDPIVTLRPRS